MNIFSEDGPNVPFWKMIGLSATILGSSMGLLWSHYRRAGRAKRRKIKDRVMRAMIEKIKGRLELSERIPRIGIRTMALELQCILEDYIDKHNSQERYLRPYVTRIDSVLTSDGQDYQERREQLIEIIDDIQEDIEH